MNNRIGLTFAGALTMALVGCAETSAPPEAASTHVAAVTVPSAGHTAAEPNDLLTPSLTDPTPALSAVATPQATRLVDIAAAPRDVSFRAVGMHLVSREGAIVVRDVIAGMPAERAGVSADMIIRAVDGLPTDSMSLHQVVDLIRGEAGASVTLTVETAGVTTEHALDRESLVTTETRCDRIQRVRHETEFGGVGLQLRAENGGFVVTEVFDAMPAADAGLTEGLTIAAVDGMAVQGSAMVDVIAAIRGETGAPVSLSVVAPDGDAREVTLTRASMVVPASSTCTR